MRERDAADVPHDRRRPRGAPARELTAAEIEALLEARVHALVDGLDAQRAGSRRGEPLDVGALHPQHVDLVQHAHPHALVERDRRCVVGANFEVPVAAAGLAKAPRDLGHQELADAAAAPGVVDRDLADVTARAERNHERVGDGLAGLGLEEERVLAVVRVPPVDLEGRLIGVDLALEAHELAVIFAACGAYAKHGGPV